MDRLPGRQNDETSSALSRVGLSQEEIKLMSVAERIAYIQPSCDPWNSRDFLTPAG